MLICIDYDGTYTADKDMWNKFILSAKASGHKVICATMRFNNHEATDVVNDLQDKCDRIIFTARKAKSAAVIAEMGIKPDIWIDDNPGWIFADARA